MLQKTFGEIIINWYIPHHENDFYLLNYYYSVFRKNTKKVLTVSLKFLYM